MGAAFVNKGVEKVRLRTGVKRGRVNVNKVFWGEKLLKSFTVCGLVAGLGSSGRSRLESD